MTRISVHEVFSSPEFVLRLIGLDHLAVEQVVRAYTGHLYKASLGLGFNEDEASELVQDVWGVFFDVLPKFRARSHIRTFLFGILYNKAKELRREKEKFSTTDPIEYVVENRFQDNGRWQNRITDPERFLMATQTMGIIENCLEALPHTQRMAFSLREVDDFGTAEICKILEVTSTNLGVLIFRAKNRLRECIESKIKA